jgi:hypothetical protein
MFYFQVPKKESDWINIATDFEKKWNFPHVVGALDGKHILVQKPMKSGSTFFNYKHTFSVVLMALVDADFLIAKFLYIDVGAQGKVSDAGVFNNCNISRKLENNMLGIPPAAKIIGTDWLCPYMVVADDAFPLKTYLMKPYSRRGLVRNEIIFNYRLSRCRRVVENAFGQLANRFRIFRTPILPQPSTTKKVVLACCVLHNFLRTREGSTLDSSENGNLDVASNDTAQATGLAPLHANGGHGRHSHEAKVLRDKLAEYFVGVGSVNWQEKIVGLE